jgi:hypothetical protein
LGSFAKIVTSRTTTNLHQFALKKLSTNFEVRSIIMHENISSVILKLFNVEFFRVASLPENLPKIDFEAYKKQLANPAAIEKLEKGV